MNHPNLLRSLLILFATATAQAADYDENVQGDLSDDHLAPTALVLSLGSNGVVATQQGNAFTRDIDYLTIQVPAGHQLSGIQLNAYSSVPANPAFMGLQAGPVFTVDASSATAADLLGGIIYGDNQVGTDILPAMGGLNMSMGFTPPLPAGDYSIWWNQTGAPSTFEMVFFVSPVGNVGTNYCSAAPNSAGPGAGIRAEGSEVVANNSFTLITEGVPANQPGVYFFGPSQAQVPFGEGFRCVGGSLIRLQPPVFATVEGVAARIVDLTAPPAVGNLVAGATTNFQLWYRDPLGGGSGFNLSDGLSVTWQ